MKKIIAMLLFISCATVPEASVPPADAGSDPVGDCWELCTRRGMQIRDVMGGECTCTRANLRDAGYLRSCLEDGGIR